MKLNLPNRLTVIRLCMVPIIMIVGLLPENACPLLLSAVLCAALFGAASLTDMFDGKIARERGLITDFGKFLDPVADKFMVIGAIFVLLYRSAGWMTVGVFVTLVLIVFRELAVTSMRLVVSTGKNVVIAANYLGKFKTVSQIVFVLCAFLEPVLYHVTVKIGFGEFLFRYNVLTWSWMFVTAVMTVWSGVNYLVEYWKYLNPDQ